jgi:hypothetical protein
MDHTHYAIVHERINDLLREGEGLRTARRISGGIWASDEDVGRDGPANGGTGRRAEHRPVRVRLGHWLIGVGNAVAGTNGDIGRGTAGRAV